MKYCTLIGLISIGLNAFCQPLGIRYTTASEDGLYSRHFIEFKEQKQCLLMTSVLSYTLTFSMENDTIQIIGISPLDTTANDLLHRMSEAKFVLRNNTLFDCVSGYTYVNADEARKFSRFTYYIIDGERYKQRNPKMKSGNIVKGDYKNTGKLARKFKSMRMRDYRTTVYKGKEAFNKFGMIGLNPVIVLERIN